MKRTNLRSLLSGTHRVILFVPEVARWLGTIEAALILQQIAYLADENDECVFGPADAQEFAISRRPFDAARKAIEAKGFATARRVGAVPRLLWSIDFDALQDEWDEWEAQNPDPGSGDVRNVHLETSVMDTTRRAERTSPTTSLEDEDLDRAEDPTQNQNSDEVEAPLASTEANAQKRSGADMAPKKVDAFTRKRNLEQLKANRERLHGGVSV